MAQATRALGATLVIRGQRTAEQRRAPIANGHVEDGIEYCFPIENWTGDEVRTYLASIGVELPAHYAYVEARILGQLPPLGKEVGPSAVAQRARDGADLVGRLHAAVQFSGAYSTSKGKAFRARGSGSRPFVNWVFTPVDWYEKGNGRSHAGRVEGRPAVYFAAWISTPAA